MPRSLDSMTGSRVNSSTRRTNLGSGSTETNWHATPSSTKNKSRTRLSYLNTLPHQQKIKDGKYMYS
jgi:hypothetical protein